MCERAAQCSRLICWAMKKREQSQDIYYEGCPECACSFCNEVQYPGGEDTP